MKRGARQGVGRLLHALYAVLLGGTVTACASVDTVLLTLNTFPPKASISDVQVLAQEPTRPHIQIAELSIASEWLSDECKRQKILEKAATLGADAVVFFEPGGQPFAQSENLLGYDSPSTESGLTGNGRRFRSDGLGLSVNYEPESGDVRVVLVRGGGGGRGGGRGGGHGRGSRGGAMRGHSSPSSVRPWARHYVPYYGPRYYGYGMYGPGGWGYAPYWNGYDPLWGDYGSYLGPGWGFIDNVLIATAIRYTESPEP